MVIAAGAVIFTSGCGSKTPQQQISEAVQQGAQAVGQQDAEKLCSIMSYQGKQWAIQYMNRPELQTCEQAAEAGMKKLSAENRRLIARTRAVKIVIEGNSAKVWIEPRVIQGIPQPIPFSRGIKGWKAG